MKINDQLNDFINSEMWALIRGALEDKVKELDSLSNIDTKLIAELQLIQIGANKEAIKIINSVINGLVSQAKAEIKEKKLYL